jgi:DHA1 family bicyclomycin/chloramphenicol resistance-like MFS transporter
VEDPAKPPAAAAMPYVEFVAMVALLMALNAMAIDVILPALQQMGASLAVHDENARQLPLTAYVAVFGVSQIFYGPLADRYGRRPVLLFGLAVYALAGFGAAVAGNFTMLLAMRALQGLGAGATRVIAIAVVRDTFGGRRMASVMSLVMMVFMAVPIVAPTLGQGVNLVAGWRGILIAVAIAGVGITTWCWLRLPETLHEEDRRPLRAGPVLEAFRMVVTNRIAAAYALGTAIMFGCIFGYINSAQQIFQETYGIGVAFPLYFSAGAIFMAISSFTNSRLVERIGMRRLSHGALIAFAIASGALCLIAIAGGGHMPFWVFYFLTTVGLCQFGFIGTNFNALAMEPLGHVAGTASAVLGSLQTFGGGVIGAFVGYAYNGTLLPLSLAFFVLALLNIAVVATVEGGRLFGGAPIVGRETGAE